MRYADGALPWYLRIPIAAAECRKAMSGYLAWLIIVPVVVLVIVLLVIECRVERKREEEDGDD